MAASCRAAVVALFVYAAHMSAVQSVGLVVSATKAWVVREGQRGRVTARAGEVLLPGDLLEAIGGGAQIYVCSSTIAPAYYAVKNGSFRVFAERVEGGSVAASAANSECLLPEVERYPTIAALHEGKLPVRVLSADERRAIAAAEPVARTLDTLERQIGENPSDIVSRVARAVLLQRSGLDESAMAEYSGIGAEWTGSKWSRHLAYTIYTARKNVLPGEGKLYALLLGVSDYKEKVPPLRFAHADAELFASFVASPRARTIAPDVRIVNLINQKASYATVRPLLNAFFNEAGEKDSILLFIAAHGVTYGDDGYVVLHDSKPGALYQNALSMKELRTILDGHAARVGRVFLFVDTCHANRIGQIRDFNRAEEQLRQNIAQLQNRKIFAFYASNNNQPSYEHARFGGGHGAFTYFLLRAMNVSKSDTDYAKVDAIDVNGQLSGQEIVDYVTGALTRSTKKQRPQADLRMDDLSLVASVPGITMPCCDPFARQPASAKRPGNRDPSTAPAGPGIRDPGMKELDLEGAMRGAAWQSPADLDERMRLEEESQRVLLQYLEGDEVPQTKADFVKGLQACESMLARFGPSLFVEARAEFFRGRVLVFEEQYEDAALHLENAIQLDPASPYAWNALGITYLEQSRFGEAEEAFATAIGRARYWAYPRHNLALVYLYRGDYERAIQAYREAMRLAPQYSYLAYNLGLVFQKMNLYDEAESQYLDAVSKAPWRPQPAIALASLMAETGRNRAAERYFKLANDLLQATPDEPARATFRHNLALFRGKKAKGLEEAKELLTSNVRDFEYLPSRFALAQLLASAWRRNHSNENLLKDALQSYDVLVQAVPANASARAEYADLLVEAGRTRDALTLLNDGLVYPGAQQALTQKIENLTGPRR